MAKKNRRAKRTERETGGGEGAAEPGDMPFMPPIRPEV